MTLASPPFLHAAPETCPPTGAESGRPHRAGPASGRAGAHPGRTTGRGSGGTCRRAAAAGSGPPRSSPSSHRRWDRCGPIPWRQSPREKKQAGVGPGSDLRRAVPTRRCRARCLHIGQLQRDHGTLAHGAVHFRLPIRPSLDVATHSSSALPASVHDPSKLLHAPGRAAITHIDARLREIFTTRRIDRRPFARGRKAGPFSSTGGPAADSGPWRHHGNPAAPGGQAACQLYPWAGCTTEKWQLRGWHGQTRLTVLVPMAPVAQKGTLKLRLGVPPVVQNLLCHNLVVHPRGPAGGALRRRGGATAREQVNIRTFFPSTFRARESPSSGRREKGFR